MGQFFTKYFPNVVPIWSGDGGVTQAINETLYMTVLTAVVAGILGIVIGILLVLTCDASHCRDGDRTNCSLGSFNCRDHTVLCTAGSKCLIDS